MSVMINRTGSCRLTIQSGVPFFLSSISLAYVRALSNRAASGWPWLLSRLAIARISRLGKIDMMNLIPLASCP